MRQVMKIKMSLPFSQSGYFPRRDILYATLIKCKHIWICAFQMLAWLSFQMPKITGWAWEGLNAGGCWQASLSSSWPGLVSFYSWIFVVLMSNKKPDQTLVSHIFTHVFNRPIQILEKVELWYLIWWKLHRSSFLKFFLHMNQVILYSHWLPCLLFPYHSQRSIHLHLIIFFCYN